jgi:hypothetical protein
MPLLIRTCVLKGHESAPSDQILKVTQLYRVGWFESRKYATSHISVCANQLEANLSV